MKEKNTHILKHISSYISKEISEQDFEVLKEWLNESPENKKIFSDYLFLYKKSKGIEFAENSNNEKDLIWNELLSKLNNPINLDVPPKKGAVKTKYLKILPVFYKYAAIVICLLSIGFIYKNYNTPNYTDDDIIISEENITLELANGQTKVVNPQGKLVDVYGNNVEFQPISPIPSIDNAQSISELEYNKLQVPHGKNIQIQLPDGSAVHLNSGSVF